MGGESELRGRCRLTLTINGVKFSVRPIPHEEGEDFPTSEDCPFWAGKQGSDRRE
jgi:hypothetical protein